MNYFLNFEFVEEMKDDDAGNEHQAHDEDGLGGDFESARAFADEHGFSGNLAAGLWLRCVSDGALFSSVFAIHCFYI